MIKGFFVDFRITILVIFFISIFIDMGLCKNHNDNYNDDKKFKLISEEFREGGTIPRIHACKQLGGKNISPQLSWFNPPKGTKSYALIIEDEDYPCGKKDKACRHWAVFNIPVSITSFSQGEKVNSIKGITEGKNYKNLIGYAGPCPPYKHTYNFTIYALKKGAPIIPKGQSLTRSQFQEIFKPYILTTSTLHGTFSP